MEFYGKAVHDNEKNKNKKKNNLLDGFPIELSKNAHLLQGLNPSLTLLNTEEREKSLLNVEFKLKSNFNNNT